MPGLACGDNNCGAGGLDRFDRIEPAGLRVSIVFLEKPRDRFFVGNVYRDERTGYRDEQQKHAAESDKSECLLLLHVYAAKLYHRVNEPTRGGLRV